MGPFGMKERRWEKGTRPPPRSTKKEERDGKSQRFENEIFIFFAPSVFLFLCESAAVSTARKRSLCKVFSSSAPQSSKPFRASSIQLLLAAARHRSHRARGRGAAVGGASGVPKLRKQLSKSMPSKIRRRRRRRLASTPPSLPFFLPLFFFSRSDDNLL